MKSYNIYKSKLQYFCCIGIFMLIFPTLGLWAQTGNSNFTVTGRVLDEDLNPIIGATIYLESTSKGTITDIDGNFKVLVHKGEKISVTYIGYEKYSLIVADSKPLEIILKSDVQLLDEVVVVGYGTLSRREVTSSISRVSGEDLNKVVGTTVSNALKGKTTGLRVFSTSGAPGSQASITIRGGSSINKSNDALILIDGVPGALSNVNSQDIASIEILKDAASTSIYGSRASNGIILITTKEGKSSKPTVTVNVSYGFQNASKQIDRLNSTEYLSVMRPALARSPYANLLQKAHPAGTGNLDNSSFSTRYLKHGESLAPGWNWMWDPISPNKVLIFEDNDIEDELFEGGNIVNAYVGLNGGTEKMKYMVSLGYVGDNGYTPKRSWDNITLRLNHSYAITKNLKLTTNLSAHKINSTPYASESAIFSRGVHLAPTIRGLMADGTDSPGKDKDYRNPLYLIDNIVNERADWGGKGKIGLSWEILNGLTAKVEGSYNVAVMHREYFEKNNYYNNLRDANYYGSNNQTSQLDFTLSYNKEFASEHKIQSVIGASSLYYNLYDYSAEAYGGSRDDIITLNGASEYTKASSTRQRERMNSFFERVTYGYKSRYLLTASLRADGSSRFAAGNRWGYFPGISAGYIMSEENFMKNLSWLSLAKIRASYGMTGNNSIGRFDYQGLWAPTTAYQGSSAYMPSALPNTSLTWESSGQVDIGFDLAFLNNRINFSFDYYNKVTRDLLFNDKLPNTSGFGTVDKNVGKVRFWGYEVQADWNIFAGKDFSWNVGGNISYNMNKVLKLPENGNYKNRMNGTLFADDYYAGIGGIAEGERLYSVIGYKVSHILDNDKAASEAMYDERAAGYDPVTQTYEKGRKIAGDYEWVDKDGSGTITAKDQFVLGYLVPTTTGGFNTTVKIRDFEIYASFDYALGHVIYDRQISLVNSGAQSGYLNPTKDVLNYWSVPGDAAKTRYARFDVEDGSDNGQWNHYRTSDENTYKGDYLSFRELKVSYNFPRTILNKTQIKAAQVYFSGQNIYCFSQYPGYMTEYSSASRNLSDGNYPQPRIWTLGLNLTF